MAVLRSLDGRILVSPGRKRLLTTTAISSSAPPVGDDTGFFMGIPGLGQTAATNTGSGTGTGAGGSTPAPVVTNATSFAISAPGMFVVGTAGTVTISPVSGTWNGQTLTPTSPGLTGAFSPPNAVGTGTAALTFQFTASAASNGFINGTAAGLSSAGAQSVSVVTPGAAGSYTPMSDILFSQPMPTNAALTEGLINDKPVVATFSPVGGIGPYTYECLNVDGTEDTDGFTAVSYRPTGVSRFAGKTDIGWICVPGPAGKSATRLLRITDGSGAPPFTKQVTIDTSLSAKRIWISAQGRTVFQDQDPFSIVWKAHPWNGSAYDNSNIVTIKSDSTGLFGLNGGYLSVNYVSQWPVAVGTYTVVLQAPGYPDETLTFQVKPGAVGQAVFIPLAGVTAHTAMVPYTPIGQLACTTALNYYSVVVSDPSGELAFDLTTNLLVLRAPPSMPGSIPFNVTISELDRNGNAIYGKSSTTTLSVPIVQGTVIPPATMVTSGLTLAFNNDTYNNVLGSIPVPAGMDASKTSWRVVSQSGYTRRGESNDYGTLAPRYQVARQSNGAAMVTAPAILSAELDGVSSYTDAVVISCTDGLKVCTKTIAPVVSWAPQSRAIYIGQGMASAHGANGYERWWDFMNAAFITYAGLPPKSLSAAHPGTWDVYISTNANPDYYVPVTGSGDRYPIQGPIRIHGIQDGSGNLPRLGGVIANNVPTFGDTSKSNCITKAVVRFGDGDAFFEMVEVSCVHGNNQGDQRGGVYKDGSTYGNVTVQKSIIRDVANGIISGHIHGRWLIDSNELSHSGTETGGAGPAHGIYVDDASELTFTNNYARLGNYGHLVKTRTTNTLIKGNRVIAGLGGSNSACIDIPDGGVCEIANNDIEHGPNSEQVNVIQWGMEALAYRTDSPYDVNSLYVHGNRINGMLMAGQHGGGPSNMLKHRPFLNRFGEPVRAVRFEDNACWIAPNPTNDPTQGKLVVTETIWTAVGPTPSITGNTTPALPFIASKARPFLPGNMPALGGMSFHYDYNENYQNFSTVWQYGDRDQISVGASDGQDTILAVLRATNDLFAQGLGTPNPFVSGTQWAVITDPVFYQTQNPNPWATTGKYTVTAQSDGSCYLKPGPTNRTTGVDFLQIRATAPNGVKSDIRYAVTVA